MILRFSATLLAILCFAPWLRAEERPLPVQLSGDDPRLRFEVYPLAKRADRKTALFVCGNPCQVLLPPGEYRVHVSGSPDHVAGDRNIDVTAAASFYFSLADRSERSTALGLAITGTALLPVGLFVALASSDCFVYCEGDQRPRTPPGVYIGLGMAAVGAVLTPVGWSQFARNRKPRIEERPLGAAPSTVQARRVELGVAPIPGGAAASMWGTF